MKAEDDYIQDAGQFSVTSEAISIASFVACTYCDCVSRLLGMLIVIQQTLC